MHFLENFLISFNDLLWGPPLLILILFVGLLYTFLLKGVQFRHFVTSHKLTFQKEDTRQKGDISNFQTIMAMLAATIGTGSITGVATALTIGGVGSLFWMWVAAAIGMVIKYTESVLAIKYRIVDESGNMSGGPMHYIERGMGKKWLAVIFSILAILTTFLGIGNMIQSNSVAQALYSLVEIKPLYSGILLAILVAISLYGGVKYLGKISAFLVPIMAIFYIGGGLCILIYHADRLPEAFSLIVKSAFSGQAATGGFVGAGIMQAMQMGLSRGIFSSEAGLGSSPVIAAAARTNSPARQGLSSMCSVFITTGIVCSISGLVIVLTNSLGALDTHGSLIDGSALVLFAFDSVIPYGGLIVTIALVPFAFSTMMSWAYLGEKCMHYLFGERSIKYYRVLYIALVIPGALLGLKLMWTVANLMNGLMAIPNLIALIYLAPVVLQESKSIATIISKKQTSKSL